MGMATGSKPFLHARLPLATIAMLLILLPFAASHFGNSLIRVADFVLLYIMMALGLNIVVGFAGLLDLGYIAFYALGAYLSGLLASPQFAVLLESLLNHYPALGLALIKILGPEITRSGVHLSVWLIVPVSAAMAACFGVLLGLPTLKLRGDYLTVVTLGFGEIIRILIVNLNDPINITDGPKGINMIDPIRVFGVSLHGEAGSHATLNVLGLTLPSVNAYYYLFLALCAAITLITVRLQDSRLGRAFVAIREDELAAKAMGIDTSKVKLLAFAMGASFGGIAGAMFAAFQGFISPESFSMAESVAVLSMVVLGGMGHVPGVVLGAVLLIALPEFLRHIVEPMQQVLLGSVMLPVEVLRQLMLGAIMVLVMLYRPAGLWPAPRREDRLAHRRGPAD